MCLGYSVSQFEYIIQQPAQFRHSLYVLSIELNEKSEKSKIFRFTSISILKPISLNILRLICQANLNALFLDLHLNQI